MDRFIVVGNAQTFRFDSALKSNMDRFIGNEIQGFYFNKPI